MKFGEQRKIQTEELCRFREKVDVIGRNLKDIGVDREFEEQKKRLIRDLSDLEIRLRQRISRLDQAYVNIAVIGLEKQGKTTLVNAWVRQEVLPTDVERCTWAATTIVNDPSTYEALVKFYTTDALDELIHSLISEFPENLRTAIPFPFPQSAGLGQDLEAALIKSNRAAFQELRNLSLAWKEVRKHLGKPDERIKGSSPTDLLSGLRPYVSLVDRDGNPQYDAYAVQYALVRLPLTEENVDFQISDLPGLNAPGNRAEKITWTSLEESADIIVWVKSGAQNPSLDGNEENVWSKAERSDESIRLTDRLFVVLSQADYEKSEHGRDCHIRAKESFIRRGVPDNRIFFSCARAELKDLELGRSFDMTDEEIEVAKLRVSNYLQQTSPTTGLPEFREAIVHFVRDELPRIENEAYRNLTGACGIVFRNVGAFLDSLADQINSQASAAPEEVRRFEELWRPSGVLERGRGLEFAIIKHLLQIENSLRADGESLEAFKSDLASTIDDLAKQMIQDITPELSLIHI